MGAEVKSRILASAVVVAAFAGCGGRDLVDGMFTEAEWAKIEELSPLPELPPSPTNKYADSPEAALLGQMLYFDEGFAAPLEVTSDLGDVGEPDTMSCNTCHEVASGWGDDRRETNRVSVGVDWGSRNSPPVINAMYYEWFYWDGRADTAWGQALAAFASGEQQNADRLHTLHRVYELYREEYDAAFDEALDPAFDPDAPDSDRFPPSGSPGDPAWDSMSAADREIATRAWVNIGKAFEAYERRLTSRNAPFDRYVAGDFTAIHESAKRGLKLFVGKAACVECHNTPLFSDSEFHNIGVPQVGERIPEDDSGRYDAVPELLGGEFNSDSRWSDDRTTGHLDGVEQSEADMGRFRTKFLRHVAETAPYMHTGQFDTLREVVELYNGGGADRGYAGTKSEHIVALNMTSSEVGDLVEFLKTLTGEPVPPSLTEDPSK